MPSTDAEPELQPIASRKHTYRLLAICAGIALLGALSLRSGAHTSSSTPRLTIYLSVAAGQWLLLRFTALGVRRAGGSLMDVAGLRGGTAKAWLLDLALAAAFVFGADFLLSLLKRTMGGVDDHTAQLLPRTALEMAVWAGLAITAGLCEELIYRGYFQRQLAAFARSRWAGLLLQAVLFGAGHTYQGWRSTVSITVFGLLAGLLVMARRSVRPMVLAHAAIDLVPLFR